jgi:RNA polymerase sigma factor (sigma-70 family)
MATNQLNRVIQTLRLATKAPDEASRTDGQLLLTYIQSREEAAFAALVRRHGPMVWGVSRRVLRSHQDAEDAFQATFLVLVRKAASIVPREMVANWLYGVAHVTALKARAAAAKRRGREKEVTAMPEPAYEPHELWDDLRPVLDRELSRLPDKYRSIIVLCDLEGKTRKEAACHFHLPEGTVATRLATARAMLAKRLRRSGVVMSGAMVAVVLSRSVATATMPASVASTTIKAASLFAAGHAAATGAISLKAVALAEGVIRTMLLTKLKIATAVLVTVAVLTAGAAAFTQQAGTGGSPNQAGSQANPGITQNSVFSGVVKTVDADKDTLTISHQGDKTFNVAKDATIVINGLSGNLTNLPIRAFVSLGLLADQKTAQSIEAVGPNVGGILKVVDPATNTVTFETKDPDGSVRLRTFTLTKTAAIQIDGRPGKLAEVPVGAAVTLNWFVDQKTARNLLANGRGFFGVPVKGVDDPKSAITFDDNGAPPELAGKTFPVAKNAMIQTDGKNNSKLAGIPVGAIVHPTLSADGKTVVLLTAEGRAFNGVQVKSVDAAKQTITFNEERVRPDLAGKTFPVAKDANVQIDGKSGKLESVPPGAMVNFTLSVDQMTIRVIQAEGRGYANVPVKAVDVDKSTITFADDKAPPELAGKTFPVVKNCNIVIEGKAGGKLAAVTAGAFAWNVNMSVDGNTVTYLLVAGPQIGNPFGFVVRAVDPQKNTITVDIPQEGDKSFIVAKDANVEIDGRPGKLASVPKDAFVFLILSVDQKTARTVQAKGFETNDVLIKAVDAANNTVTFADDARAAQVAGKTFIVAKDADVAIDGKPGKLSAVPPGASAWLWLSVDQKSLVRLHVGGSQVGGFGGVVVQSVDADKNTITVDIYGEGEKTFAVAKDADIQIDGKSGNLAALPKEAPVVIALRADQKTVRSIQARTQ